jgi:hypothetical protein
MIGLLNTCYNIIVTGFLDYVCGLLYFAFENQHQIQSRIPKGFLNCESGPQGVFFGSATLHTTRLSSTDLSTVLCNPLLLWQHYESACTEQGKAFGSATHVLASFKVKILRKHPFQSWTSEHWTCVNWISRSRIYFLMKKQKVENIMTLSL